MSSPDSTTTIVSSQKLWYGLAAPAFAWITQEMVSAVIAVRVCEDGHVALARGLVAVVTLVAIAVSLSGGFVATRSWRELSRRSSDPSGHSLATTDARGRETMMAVAGIGVAITLTLGLVWSGMPALFVSDICGAKR